MFGKTNAIQNNGGSGGAYQIVVGELPDTVVELYDGVTLLDTKTITNTKITFDVTTPKTYTIKKQYKIVLKFGHKILKLAKLEYIFARVESH